MTSVKTILILAANPTSTTRLRLDEEMREIVEGLRRSNNREQFRLEQRWAVRQRDFYRAILDCQPQIVHFMGHGAGEDGIVLEDETGQEKLVDADVLASLFEVFAQKGVECVVLNACFSKVQAQAIATHVSYVIGMDREVGDRAAVNFAVAFYDTLAAGGDVENAFKLGCSQLLGIDKHLTPQLLKNEFSRKANSQSQKKVEFKLHSQRVNYTQLHNLLAAQRWLEADQETIKVMLKATGKSGSLSSGDLKDIPCEDLYIIDRLWKEHSQERFGFSSQARIYQQVREDYDNFCTRVGWKVGQRWKGYNELNWTSYAPVGHLPHMQGRKLYPTTEQNREFHLNSWALDLGDKAFGLMESFGLMEGTLISVLTQRLADCNFN
jgi:hypothetical protein